MTDSFTSQRPWKIELEHQGVRGRKENITIVAKRGVVARVGDTSMTGAMDDAELIVRAVNAHDALVAACERIVQEAARDCLSDDEWSEGEKMARAALAKARGET